MESATEDQISDFIRYIVMDLTRAAMTSVMLESHAMYKYMSKLHMETPIAEIQAKLQKLKTGELRQIELVADRLYRLIEELSELPPNRLGAYRALVRMFEIATIAKLVHFEDNSTGEVLKMAAKLSGLNLELLTVENLDMQILQSMDVRFALNMYVWFENLGRSPYGERCETSCCRAGAACYLAGEYAIDLMRKTAPWLVASLVYYLSRGSIPNFRESTEAATASIAMDAKNFNLNRRSADGTVHAMVGSDSILNVVGFSV